MKLNDSLSGELVELAAVCPDRRVSFYSCGPTVYDYPHIGNWYSFLRWDLLVRALETQDWQVDWVMNITDVGHLTSDADDGEDKLAVRAKQQGQTAWQIADFYGGYFDQALGRLNFRRPNRLPKATDHIDQMVELVSQLEAAGLTYKIDDGIYFDTAKWPDYGRLARASPADDGQSRLEPNPSKRSPADFALWKLTPTGVKRDMEWPSPWGAGFPGWHIECSAMCRHYLGQTVTIHAGGIDHIPVHHTNEIAQIEPVTKRPFARIWLHSNFILVDGQKMSKSAGNYTTLEEIEARGYSLAEFRLAVLAANYRTMANFSRQLLAAARKRYQQLLALVAVRYQLLEQPESDSPDPEICQRLGQQLIEALNNDLNSPQALSLLDQFFNQSLDRAWATNAGTELDQLIRLVEQIFGLKLIDQVPDLSSQQRQLLDRRQTARQAADYRAADAVRAQLAEKGIEVRDLGRDRQRWLPLWPGPGQVSSD